MNKTLERCIVDYIKNDIVPECKLNVIQNDLLYIYKKLYNKLFFVELTQYKGYTPYDLINDCIADIIKAKDE